MGKVYSNWPKPVVVLNSSECFDYDSKNATRSYPDVLRSIPSFQIKTTDCG